MRRKTGFGLPIKHCKAVACKHFLLRNGNITFRIWRKIMQAFPRRAEGLG